MLQYNYHSMILASLGDIQAPCGKLGDPIETGKFNRTVVSGVGETTSSGVSGNKHIISLT